MNLSSYMIFVLLLVACTPTTQHRELPEERTALFRLPSVEVTAQVVGVAYEAQEMIVQEGAQDKVFVPQDQVTLKLLEVDKTLDPDEVLPFDVGTEVEVTFAYTARPVQLVDEQKEVVDGDSVSVKLGEVRVEEGKYVFITNQNAELPGVKEGDVIRTTLTHLNTVHMYTIVSNEMEA